MDIAFDSLKDLTLAIQQVEGFHAVIAALKNGRAATIDGAWNSSAALTAAALGLHAPHTLVVVLAHPGDIDAWCEDIASFAGLRPAVFAAWDAWPVGGEVIDEVAGQRLRLLRQLENEPPRFIVTTLQALLQPVPASTQLGERRKKVRKGSAIGLEELTVWLVEHGFQRRDTIELAGEFSRRGGILDVFSPDAEAPYRLEFFGDEIESIRQFAVATQRSMGEVAAVEIVGAVRNDGPSTADSGHAFDYLPGDAWIVLAEPDDIQEKGKHYLERVSDVRGLFSIPSVFQQVLRFPSISVTALPATSEELTCHLHIESVERFSGEVAKLRDELDAATAGERVLIACHNEAERKRLGDVLAAGRLAQTGQLKLVLGRVHAGFRLIGTSEGSEKEGSGQKTKGSRNKKNPPDVARSKPTILVLSDNELFHREEVRTVVPRRQLESRAIDSFLDLAEGDLVVHLSHGIARYRGMQVLEKSGQHRGTPHSRVPRRTADLRAGFENRLGAEIRRRRQDRPGAVQGRRRRLAAQKGQGPGSRARPGQRNGRAASPPRISAGRRIPPRHANGSPSLRPLFRMRKRQTSSRRSAKSNATCNALGPWTG